MVDFLGVTGVQGGYTGYVLQIYTIVYDLRIWSTIQADNVRFKGVCATSSDDSVMVMDSDTNKWRRILVASLRQLSDGVLALS